MFTRLSPRSSLFSSLIRALTFCHYAHNCIECKVFVVLNAHALRAVRCVFLIMLYALSVRKGQHVPVLCIYGRVCVCCYVVCLSLFHGAILRQVFGLTMDSGH